MSNLGFRMIRDIQRPGNELLEKFKNTQTAFIGDCVNRFYCLDSKIKMINKDSSIKMVGSAFTVKTRIADNLMVHKALDMVKPGDVIVIDAEGSTNAAIFGDHMVHMAINKKCAGYVVDGCIRDAEDIEKSKFPVFAIGVNPRGPYKDGPGEINVPISCGGVVVMPGDIIVGDRDGVAVIPLAEAESVLEKLQSIFTKEEKSTKDNEEGTQDRAWVDETLNNKGCELI
ncbi:MAG: RraA family protein [Atribacterota bacterium]|nr:RraA family protein [Atribacterota bacterium]